MNGVGFEILARTRVRQLPTSDPREVLALFYFSVFTIENYKH